MKKSPLLISKILFFGLITLTVRAENDLGSMTMDEGSRFAEKMRKAEAGDAKAQYEVGWCYSFGAGVGKDEKKAFEWLKKSADQGNAKAQYSLGNLYIMGNGVEKDKDKAIEWYKKSAEQGYEKAKRNLKGIEAGTLK